MTSTVACIGFTDPGALAAIVRERGKPFHELSSTAQWVDPSGAMLLLDQTSQRARPGFDTEVRTPYRHLVALESGLAQVFLTDAAGAELEPVTVTPLARYTVGWAVSGRVALVAMGLDAEFFATVEDFFDSPRSAMPGSEEEPPPEVRQFGLPWPPPLEIESLLPAAQAPRATLSGTVQWAEVRTNTRTGHEFLLARVTTLFGAIDLCTPVPVEGAPSPGNIVVGTVEMLATFPPHGEADLSAYVPPSEKVAPNFRDESLGANGSQADVVLNAADVSLPDGLVLGEDGMVRTEAEHREWKGITSSSSTQPRRERESTPIGQVRVNPAADVPNHSAPQGPSSTTTNVDDDLPRPGETRRQWRSRTGRA